MYCSKKSYTYAQIADELVKRVTNEVRNLSIGDPAENKTIGPLINSKQCDYVQGLINDALDKGALLKYGNQKEGT